MQWLIDVLRVDALPQIAVKLLLALVLGSLIGFERENNARPAGLRTHVLVCLGATVVQLTSINFYATVGGDGDPFRLGAQVISGIGFLGAGTILKAGPNIKGLTTAASLWATACIGLTIGAGLYLEAVAAILVVMASLKGLSGVERLIDRRRKSALLLVVMENTSHNVGVVFAALAELELQITNVEAHPLDIGLMQFEFTLRSKRVIPVSDVLSVVGGKNGVQSVQFTH